MKYFLILFTFFFCSFYGCLVGTMPLSAQHPIAEPCATDFFVRQALKNNPNLAAKQAEIARFTEKYIAENALQKGGNEIITLPIVVHVVWSLGNPASNISDEQILSQIDELNRIYRRQNENASETRPEFLPVAADCQIEFCLARRDPNGNPTNGITRTPSDTLNWLGDGMKFSATGGHNAWPSNNYLNIWVVNRIRGGVVLGYSYMPGTAPSPTVDGVVIAQNVFGTIGTPNPPYNLGRTAAHEIGHWLNLNHTWGPGNDPIDPDCDLYCVIDDGVNDTPTTCHANFGCPGFINTCTDTPTDLPDMTENYMDYATDICQNAFTVGQKNRMRAMLVFGGFRYSLTTDPLVCSPIEQGTNDVKVVEVLSPTGPNNCTQVSPVVSFQNFGTAPLSSVLFNYSVEGGTTTLSQTWNGLLAPLESTQVTLFPIATVSNGIVHTLIVNASAPNGSDDFNISDNTAEKSFATIPVGIPSPYLQDFEAGTLPANFSIFNPDADITFALNTSVGYNSNQSIFINNYNYFQTGESDDIVLPKIDLTTLSDPYLAFYVAYALRNSDNNSDALEVLLSSDCGQTYNSIYISSDDSLISVPPTPISFIPTSPAEWRLVNIDLAPYNMMHNIQLKFRHKRGSGNNLYIDDINLRSGPLTPLVGIESPATLDNNKPADLLLVPNYNAQTIYIIPPTQFLQQNASNPIKMEVVNMLGQKIIAQSLLPTAGNQSHINLPLERINNGLYLLHLTNSENQSVIGKFIWLNR